LLMEVTTLSKRALTGALKELVPQVEALQKTVEALLNAGIATQNQVTQLRKEFDDVMKVLAQRGIVPVEAIIDARAAILMAEKPEEKKEEVKKE
jgi:hypothetical protein